MKFNNYLRIAIAGTTAAGIAISVISGNAGGEDIDSYATAGSFLDGFKDGVGMIFQYAREAVTGNEPELELYNRSDTSVSYKAGVWSGLAFDFVVPTGIAVWYRMRKIRKVEKAEEQRNESDESMTDTSMSDFFRDMDSRLENTVLQ